MSRGPKAGSVFGGAIASHLDVVRQVRKQLPVLAEMAKAMASAVRGGGKILWCGNGGSAADAQHLAAEIVGRFRQQRRALPAMALTTDSSILTAVANDFGYEAVFARQVEALGIPGDVVVGISTSGNSPNVAAALQTARAQGLTTVAFTGEGGGHMASLADHLFAVASRDTARIQEAHILAGHMLCDWIEQDWMVTEDRLRAIAWAARNLAALPAPAMQILEVS
jgi:D-sedoheptulose 7-phosphate isomerase